VPAAAIVLDQPEPLVLARNAARGRGAVPDAAVRAHLAQVAVARETGRLEAEGFAIVVRLVDPASVDAVEIELGPGP